MNKKLSKILAEIEKAKEKLSEQQGKLRELERQKTELENTEMVELIRSTKMNTEELSIFLRAFREKSEVPIFMPKQEEQHDEEN
ncbi:DUF4315 family protein [Lacrimispora sp.]|uniref:DUF4315 family protein n=1 Tax=Lacrimispora sp. TaxID=2719234 RepID=UPI00399168EE